ncbi:hypothetical protein JNM87_04650 [Candidatus Saccharibacteria bacterium]|nr:hypothetical protein [Candidatus Saccharibacteria bacterium]
MDGYPLHAQNGKDIDCSSTDPEMLRADPTDIVLRLATAGLSFAELPLMDRPLASEQSRSTIYLHTVGAMNKDAGLTKRGAEMAGLPVDPLFARMIVESRQYDAAIQLQMIAAVAAAQVQGITRTGRDEQQWRNLSYENRSDMLMQLEVLIKTMQMDERQRAQHDIIEQRLDKVKVIIERLAREVGLDAKELRTPTDTEKQQLLGCIASGMPELFVKVGHEKYRASNGRVWVLSDSSVVDMSHRLIMGRPFELHQMRSAGPKARSLITEATGVTIEMLQERTPDRLQYKDKELVVSSDGTVEQCQEVFFDGISTRQTVNVVPEPSVNVRDYAIRALLSRASPTCSSDQLEAVYAAIDEIEDLQHRTDRDLGLAKLQASIIAVVKSADITRVRSVQDAADRIDSAMITAHVSQKVRDDVLLGAPDRIVIPGLNDGGDIPVIYEDNVAYITVRAQDIPLLPDEISELGDRRVMVRESTHTKRYMPLIESREYFARQSRSARRGTIDETVPAHVVLTTNISQDADPETERPHYIGLPPVWRPDTRRYRKV